jgi:hypothetical protein
MSSKVGLLSILGRTGLGKLLMISSTVSALLGAMDVLVCACEGRGLLDGDNVKEINFIEQYLITKGDMSAFTQV